jgi:hypothetical protein
MPSPPLNVLCGCNLKTKRDGVSTGKRLRQTPKRNQVEPLRFPMQGTGLSDREARIDKAEQQHGSLADLHWPGDHDPF